MTELLQTQDHADTIELGSDRAFGLVFTVAFCVFTGLFYINEHQEFIIPSLGIAGVFLILALVAPSLLHPLNLLWFKFGLLLHKIISPIVLAFLFFGTITPITIVMRLMGKDLLNLRLAPDATSYWVPRDPPGPSRESMSDQF